LLLWVNEGLMVVFFMLVELEVKRAVVEGELSSLSNAALPVIAALGGMTGSALVYLACNWGNADALRGWPISTATDIAFALGVLALLGPRAPPSLKIFCWLWRSSTISARSSSSRCSTRPSCR